VNTAKHFSNPAFPNHIPHLVSHLLHLLFMHNCLYLVL
jgi:hypothetical protein